MQNFDCPLISCHAWADGRAVFIPRRRDDGGVDRPGILKNSGRHVGFVLIYPEQRRISYAFLWLFLPRPLSGSFLFFPLSAIEREWCFLLFEWKMRDKFFRVLYNLGSYIHLINFLKKIMIIFRAPKSWPCIILEESYWIM